MGYLSKSGFQILWAQILDKLKGKVDAVDGKGLSTNDFTDAEKAKLAELNGEQEYRINAIASYENGNISSISKDKTFAEMLDAYEAGKHLVVYLTHEETEMPVSFALTVASNEYMVFTTPLVEDGLASMLMIGADESIQEMTNDIIHPLTFTGAVEATFNGTGNVTVEIPKGAFVVNASDLSVDGGAATVDKTYEEIVAANNAGQSVVCIATIEQGVQFLLRLSTVINNYEELDQMVVFEGESSLSPGTIIALVINKNGTASSMQMPAQTYGSLEFTGAVEATFNGSESVTVEIPKELPDGAEAHQMLVTDAEGNKKWEEKTHWKETVEGVVLEETTFELQDGMYVGQTPLTTPLADAGKYTVTIGSNSFESTGKAVTVGVDVVFIGNPSYVGVGEDNGESFVLIQVPEAMIESFGGYWQFMIPEANGNVTLSVTGTSEVYKKLDRQYLPAATNSYLVNGSEMGALRSVASVVETDEYKMGQGASAFGEQTKASGNASFAEGKYTEASGEASHAEGYGSTAEEYNSHAEGYFATASGLASHAEGQNTTASGSLSHAEGNESTASGNESHAEGTRTTASGAISHAEGRGTTAHGSGSHSEGLETRAYSNYQHAQGKYNVIDNANKYAHIVGNGVSNVARSNAHTLDWDGNAWYAGDVYVGGNNQDEGERLAKTSEVEPADWSINDETDPAYVKNRTHWVEDNGVVEVLPECKPVVMDEGSGDIFATIFEPLFTEDIIAGETYTVYWNGTPYTTTAVLSEEDGEQMWVLGDFGLLSGGVSTGEPFVIVYVTEETGATYGYYAQIMPIDGSTDITLKIERGGIVYHTIAQEYLPEYLYGYVGGEEICLPEVNLVISENENVGAFAQKFTSDLVVGEEYTVIWNGVSYTATAKEGEDNTVYLGNRYYLKGTYEDTGELFFVMQAKGEDVLSQGLYGGVATSRDNLAEAKEISVSITKDGKKIRKIPEEFLPDSINGKVITLTVDPSTGTFIADTPFTEAWAMTELELQKAVRFDMETFGMFTGGASSGICSVSKQSITNVIDQIIVHLYLSATVGENNNAPEMVQLVWNNNDQIIARYLDQLPYIDNPTKYLTLYYNYGSEEWQANYNHTVSNEGDGWFAGDVYVGGTDQTTGSEKLMTQSEVTAAINAALAAILPTPTANDAGKILRVNAEGKYELVALPNAEEATF